MLSPGSGGARAGPRRQSASSTGGGPSAARPRRRTARARARTTSPRDKMPTVRKRGSTTGIRSTPLSSILTTASVKGSSTHATLGPRALMTSRTHQSWPPLPGRRKEAPLWPLGMWANRSACVTTPINRPASRTGAPPTPWRRSSAMASQIRVSGGNVRTAVVIACRTVPRSSASTLLCDRSFTSFISSTVPMIPGWDARQRDRTTHAGRDVSTGAAPLRREYTRARAGTR